MKKRGQNIMGLPFSIIFSIILIIFFIIAAIVAIKIFWNPNKDACTTFDETQEGMFRQDLQDVVNDAWDSDRSERNFTISLPSKIDYVCFLDTARAKSGKYRNFYENLTIYKEDDNANLFFYPVKSACEDFRGIEIQRINITAITAKDNPYCIPNKKASIIVEKGFYEGLVKIR
jgi:hypothetical protein